MCENWEVEVKLRRVKDAASESLPKLRVARTQRRDGPLLERAFRASELVCLFGRGSTNNFESTVVAVLYSTSTSITLRQQTTPAALSPTANTAGGRRRHLGAAREHATLRRLLLLLPLPPLSSRTTATSTTSRAPSASSHAVTGDNTIDGSPASP